MRNLLFFSSTVLALGLVSTQASAADLGLAPGSYDWSGGYVGLNAGASFDSSSFKSNYEYVGDLDIGATFDLIDELDFSGESDDVGFTAGLLAGYNWQFGSFVVGGEADLNYIAIEGRVSHNAADVMNQIMQPTNVTANDTIDYSADWFGTVRARLGYAVDNVLVYGTGGIAYGQMKVKQNLDAYDDLGEYAQWKGSADGYNLGWTLGGGLEYGMDRWVFGAEYLYVDLGSYEWGSSGNVSLYDPVLSEDFGNVKQKGKADYSFSIARASLKYRF